MGSAQCGGRAVTGACECAVCPLTRETQSTIKFINSEAASIHGSVRVGSVYTSESGEWKVGGFELLSSVKEDESTIYVC